MRHRVVERDDRHDGLRQRQHELEEELRVAAAVDLRGLQQVVRDGVLDERPGDDQVVGGDCAGQQDRPDGVDDVQVLHQDVVGDQAAVEHHGEGEQEREEAAPGQRFAREGIGGEHRHGDVDERADDGVEDRVAVADEHRFVLEDGLIAAQAEIHRPEGHLARGHGGGRGEGRGDDVDQRIEHHQRQQAHEQVDEQVEQAVAVAYPLPTLPVFDRSDHAVTSFTKATFR